MKITGQYGLDLIKIDVNRLVMEICDRYAKLIPAYKFKYQAVISAEFRKHIEYEPD